jgi:hypothetical protein
MSYCNQGPFFTPACCQFLVSCMIKGIFCPCGCPCYLGKDIFHLFVPMGCASTFFLPALSLFPGDIPAQEAKCFSVGKTPISNPISATRSSTLLELMPGTFLSSFPMHSRMGTKLLLSVGSGFRWYAAYYPFPGG